MMVDEIVSAHGTKYRSDEDSSHLDERVKARQVALQEGFQERGANGMQAEPPKGTMILPGPEMLLPRDDVTVFSPIVLRCAEETQRQWMRVRRERGS